MFGLFRSNNSVKSLQAKSKKVVNVFTSTIDQLVKINNQALSSITNNDIRIEKLTEQNTTLGEVVKNNTTVIKKLSKILED
jgi:hypothetical protein